MMAGRFDPEELFGQSSAVAHVVPASDVFGLFRRTLPLPPEWAALTTRTQGDRVVVGAGDTVRSEDVDQILLFRTTPIELSWEDETVVTRDQFQCRVQLRCSVSLILERSDLTSFENALLGSHRRVETEDMVRRLKPVAHAALTPVAAAHDAASLVDGKLGGAISSALALALKSFCFASGLGLDGAPTATFRSQTLKKVRTAEEEAVRRRLEHEASREVQRALESAQADHLDHLASLLDRLKGLASASPDVALPELIRSFTERERGELYEALFASGHKAGETQWIVVASGDALLFFDPSDLSRPARRLSVHEEAGPVRSVQSTADGTLLLGARSGVYRMPIDAASPVTTFVAPDRDDVRGGFNAAVIVGTNLYTSHSELGLLAWDLDQPATPTSLFASMTREAKVVRNVSAADGCLYCSMDDRVLRWTPGAIAPECIFAGSPATITALSITGNVVLAGNARGDVLRWHIDRPDTPDRLHTGSGRPAESLWLLDTHSVPRLVFVDTSLQVHMRVLGDSFTCGYEAGGQTLRRIEVAGDLIVATNDLRDRLILWTPGTPQRPSGTVSVSQLTGRSIQDVCLIATTT